MPTWNGPACSSLWPIPYVNATTTKGQPVNDQLALLEQEAHSPLSSQLPQSTPPESPRLADLLDEIDVLILRFAKLPKPELAMLLAVWIAGTYTFSHFRYCGYLA